MKKLLFIILISTTLQAFCQKRLTQTYDEAGITGIYINSNEIFQIKITATQTDKITMHTAIDGETFETSLLNSRVENNQLYITTGRTPDYEPFNDKLSAHKVLSVALELEVPEGFDLDIYSTLASVDGTGDFGRVTMNLGRGGCRMEEFRFRESVQINTLTGSITVETPQTTVTATSRNGNVQIESSFTEGTAVMLQSIDGDITVIKSE